MARHNSTEYNTAGPPRGTLLGMYLLELSAVLYLLVIYKAGDAAFPDVVTSRLGLGIALAAAAFVSGLVMMLRDLFSLSSRRSMALAVALNLVSIVLIIGISEASLRAITRVAPNIVTLFPRGFLPRDWQEVAASNRMLLSQDDMDAETFLEFDNVLGWKPGAGRISKDRMHASSAERIRSATPDHSFRSSSAPRRIALLGNSYTFGVGVPFEQTWGQRLEERLGDDFEVLNFGVNGYGVDQAYLRYVEEARAWKADVAVLGLITHDLFRSQAVYPFISFPAWQLPFGKPRYVLEGQRLVLSNVPLLPPDVLFAAERVEDLPVIGLEPDYFAPEWKRRWYHGLYSVRFLISAWPRWPPARPDEMRSVKQLNAAIVKAFVDAAARDGSRAVVVFFPSYGAGELGPPTKGANPEAGRLVHDTLTEAGVDYLSLDSCLQGLPATLGLASDGRHYSPEANKMVADCLYIHLQGLGLIP